MSIPLKLSAVVPFLPKGGMLLGRVLGLEDGSVRVSVEGRLEPFLARPLSQIDHSSLEEAALNGAEALIIIDEGLPSPVLLGLLGSTTPMVDAILAGPQLAEPRVARVDGKRVVVEGRDEVELHCGKASLTLRRNGEVVLKGVTIVTQAERTNKIRGGKVQIN